MMMRKLKNENQPPQAQTAAFLLQAEGHPLFFMFILY